MEFLLRWMAAFVLLAVTYNPTSVNYVRWVAGTWPDQMPLIVLAGLVLLTVYVVFLTALLRGIGALGVVLVLAVFGALIWVLVDIGWLDLRDPKATIWLSVTALSLVLAIGMYWGILWRKISGQLEVDDEGQGG